MGAHSFVYDLGENYRSGKEHDKKNRKSSKRAAVSNEKQQGILAEQEKLEIQQLRQELSELVAEKGSFLDPEVLKLSEKLDCLLLRHLKNRLNS